MSQYSSDTGSNSMRKSFVFTIEAAQKLERLTKICRLDSLSNTIRLALIVLEELVTVIQKGGVIITRDADGKERFYHPLLEQILTWQYPLLGLQIKTSRGNTS